MAESCNQCVFCKIKELEARLDDLPDNEEVRSIREELTEIKLDIELLKKGISEHNH